MEPSKRIVINTLAQHTRAIINTCLSLYSTRLVLQALGQSDYGIYSLVAGVVTMLAFLTGALVITTQRQLSFYHGKGNITEVRGMFSSSLLLHILIGGSIAIVLLAFTPFIFGGFLDIDPTRVPTAKGVYYLAILSLVIVFFTAPYKALFIAREEIYYVSMVDVMDGILKLAFALSLPFITFDRLMAYAFAIAGIQAFHFLALSLWAVNHFKESMLLPRLSLVRRCYLKELTGFATWTVYSTGCVMGRTQGVAIILNRFFGTIVNSAYGIAQQVYHSIAFISQAVTNAMSPQIVKAESIGNRQRMFHLAELSSKYNFLLLSTVVIPLSFELPEVLKLWLGDVPPHAVTLCRFVILSALCDQITFGLGTANQAIGRIRNYSLVVNTIKVLTLPAFWLCLHFGYEIGQAMWAYIGFEILCALVRLPFLEITAGLSIRHFASHVFARVAIPLLCIAIACWIMVTYVNVPFRFLLTGTVSVVVAGISCWLFALGDAERHAAQQMIKKKK
ncbi:MAG: hypothetical protein IKW91_02320 [Bacteroidaceae bacterium]|nr:hypothetical protein [Bacteroidaceae bacterium]